MVATLAVAVAWLGVAATAQAHQLKHKNLTIIHPWVKPTPNPAEGEILHVKINNTGAAERLLAATTQRATNVVLQEVSADAVARNVEFISLPATSSVELGNTSHRIRLEGLKAPLDAYDSFEMTLHFAKAGKIVIEVLVDE